MLKNLILFFLCLFAISTTLIGQSPKAPIKDFGRTFPLEDPDFKIDENQILKVVFDIHDRPQNPAQVNAQINTLARFINMHAKAGVPLEHLKVVGVIHNKASKNALNDEAYRAEFGVDNPNIPLMEALTEAGAEIYICGQSMYARDVPKEKLAAPVKTALSAMTVFIALNEKGYRLIKF